MAKRGRPVGWRKDVTRPHRVMVQLSEDERGWLASRVPDGGSDSDVVRALIEDERKREMDNNWWSSTGKQVAAENRSNGASYYRPARAGEALGRRDVVVEVLGAGGAAMLTDDLPEAVRAAWERAEQSG